MAKQIQVSRVFDAPVAMVWKIWTDAELVKRWWGPKHFSSQMARIDFREGGKSLVSMLAPPQMGGQEFYSAWLYIRIVPLQTIEFMQHLADKNGDRVSPLAVGMPADFPVDIRTIVDFKVLGAGTTEMTITEYAAFGTISQFAQIGLEQSMDKMLVIFE